MALWMVQRADGDHDQVDGGMLAMEGGAFLAFSDDGHFVRAGALEQWRTVRLVANADADPTLLGADAMLGSHSGANALVGQPRLT